ncbi:MAG: transposase [Methylocella sp.]
MPLTLKKEAIRPPGMNSLQQQASFDALVQEFDTERPHAALIIKWPAEIHSASPGPYDGSPEFTSPLHGRAVLPTARGRIRMYRKRITIAAVRSGQRLGIKAVDAGISIVSFMRDDLGLTVLERKTWQPIDKAFGPRLSPMT